MCDEHHTLRDGGIEATIKAHGAELSSLKDAQGVELIWQAGAAWPRHAPLLFPIVGRLKGDTLRHRGKAYPMTQHGFARDQVFEWTVRDATSCSLLLRDSAATRSHYPFAFQLAIGYRLRAAGLEVTLEIANTGEEMLPASIGAHPAFNWPLLEGAAKESYGLTFSEPEVDPIRRLKDGLMQEKPEPSPIEGKTLALSERLFDDDALILDRLASAQVRYAADRSPSLSVSWDGFHQLGIWSKPGGAAFLCIEPWRGFASPANFDGEFADKPGIMHLAPGNKEVLRYRIGVNFDDPASDR
jgi:galactose mutarotase-like enzyme